MRADPIRQRLCEGCLGVGVIGGAEHGDEDLGGADLPCRPVDHLHGAARIIDEQLLAGDMDLPQRRLQPANPVLVEVAEPGIAEPVRLARLVLLPEQGERDVGPAQLAVHLGPVRLRAQLGRQVWRRREEMRLEPIVIVEFGRQRPSQTRLARPAEILADRPLSETQAPGNDVLRQAGRMAKPKQFAKIPHGQSVGGHLVSLVERARLTRG